MKEPAVYILASKVMGQVYTGVTSNLRQRIYQHQTEQYKGYTADNNIKLLVWYEFLPTMDSAIAAEKRIKSWGRKKKFRLIESMNPSWRDLSLDF